MYIWCYALLHPIYPCYTILSSVTPCFEAEVAILCSVTPCYACNAAETLCYIVLCNVSPCFAAEIHCYTNVMQCYAGLCSVMQWLHLLYHTVVGIIHPVKLCLEREI